MISISLALIRKRVVQFAFVEHEIGTDHDRAAAGDAAVACNVSA